MYSQSAISFAFLLFITASSELTYGKFSRVLPDNGGLAFDMSNGICSPLQTDDLETSDMWLMTNNKAVLFDGLDYRLSVSSLYPVFLSQAQTYTTLNGWLFRSAYKVPGLYFQELSDDSIGVPSWAAVFDPWGTYTANKWTAAICAFPIAKDPDHPTYPVWILNGGETANGVARADTYMWLWSTSGASDTRGGAPKMKIARKNHGMSFCFNNCSRDMLKYI